MVTLCLLAHINYDMHSFECAIISGSLHFGYGVQYQGVIVICSTNAFNIGFVGPLQLCHTILGSVLLYWIGSFGVNKRQYTSTCGINICIGECLIILDRINHGLTLGLTTYCIKGNLKRHLRIESPRTPTEEEPMSYSSFRVKPNHCNHT